MSTMPFQEDYSETPLILILGFMLLVITCTMAIILGIVILVNRTAGQINLNAEVCTYQSQTYNDGEVFSKGDKCNQCICNNGTVVCTSVVCN